MLAMYVKLTMGVSYVFCYSPSVCLLPLATSLHMFDMAVAEAAPSKARQNFFPI